MKNKKTTFTAYNKLFKEEVIAQEKMLSTELRKRKLTIGIPTETDKFENRIGLVPQSVELLTHHNHEIIIQRGAGKKANFSDTDYSEVGALIVDDKETIYKSDIILKIAPPTPEEINLIPRGKTLLSTFHAQIQSKETLQLLKQKKLSAIGFEYIQDDDNTFPFVSSMSEIAGNASILLAAEYLSSGQNGIGKLLGGITGVNPAEVIIIGAGTVAEQAARAAIGLGAMVKIFDDSIYKLRKIRNRIGYNLYTSVLQPIVLYNALRTADVVIAAKWLNEGKRELCISEELVKQMKKGSVIIDVSIDKGGCVETSKLTTHGKPTFTKHGVIHYGVPNIASRFARTASYALSNLLEKMIVDISQSGNLDTVIRENTSIRNGLYFYNGILTKESISQLFDFPYKDIDLLLYAY